jgi:predicted transcriptional regulator
MNETTEPTNHIGLVADIVSAYVSKNSVRAADLPELIASIHQAVSKAATGAVEQPVEELRPPVPIKKSLTPDFIISLEDGKRYKSLKRHLRGRDLTPDQYRQKWGLPRDYPMVAPNYAKQRSELAKSLGLGQIRRQRAQAEEAVVDSAPVRGRRKKMAEAA